MTTFLLKDEFYHCIYFIDQKTQVPIHMYSDLHGFNLSIIYSAVNLSRHFKICNLKWANFCDMFYISFSLKPRIKTYSLLRKNKHLVIRIGINEKKSLYFSRDV